MLRGLRRDDARQRHRGAQDSPRACWTTSRPTAPTEAEVERAKGHLRGSLILSLEDSANRMSRLGKSELVRGEILTVGRAPGQGRCREACPTSPGWLADLFRPEGRVLTVVGPVENGGPAGLVGRSGGPPALSGGFRPGKCGNDSETRRSRAERGGRTGGSKEGSPWPVRDAGQRSSSYKWTALSNNHARRVHGERGLVDCHHLAAGHLPGASTSIPCSRRTSSTSCGCSRAYLVVTAVLVVSLGRLRRHVRAGPHVQTPAFGHPSRWHRSGPLASRGAPGSSAAMEMIVIAGHPGHRGGRCCSPTSTAILTDGLFPWRSGARRWGST